MIVVPEEWSSNLSTSKVIDGQNPAYRPSSFHSFDNFWRFSIVFVRLRIGRTSKSRKKRILSVVLHKIPLQNHKFPYILHKIPYFIFWGVLIFSGPRR